MGWNVFLKRFCTALVINNKQDVAVRYNKDFHASIDWIYSSVSSGTCTQNYPNTAKNPRNNDNDKNTTIRWNISFLTYFLSLSLVGELIFSI